jgi:hypothetical protein
MTAGTIIIIGMTLEMDQDAITTLHHKAATPIHKNGVQETDVIGGHFYEDA